MADKKEKHLTPLEELTATHAKGIAERKQTRDDLGEELRTAEAMVKETRLKIAQVQQANLVASLAYDDAVAELRKADATKAA